MRSRIQIFVSESVVCQLVKYLSPAPAGLLQPSPIPNRVWEDVLVDFIKWLPKSEGYNVVLEVVDHLSK